MNQGKVDVLLGLQWGDEGKGKVILILKKLNIYIITYVRLINERW